MSQRLPDRDLDRLLADLPRQAASPGFSRRLLDHLDRPPRRRASRAWLLAAAATAMVVLAVALWLAPHPGARPQQAEAAALEEEHRLLMEELAALKASLRSAQTAPVIYVGGNEQVDLVLDLGPIWQGEARPGVQPAAHEGERVLSAADRLRGERR